MAEARRITAITTTKRDSQRATIKVDDEAVATLSQKRIAQLGVEVGQPWDATLAREVEAAASFDKAMMHAMNALSRKALSRFELDRKLERKGHEDTVRRDALDRLVELELIDDAALGEALVRELMQTQPAGPRLLRHKLMQKGLERALIDRLVDEATRDSDEQYDSALALARKRLARLRDLEPAKRKRRLYGQLARRGFEPETIDRVMEALADELSDDEEPA